MRRSSLWSYSSIAYGGLLVSISLACRFFTPQISRPVWIRGHFSWTVGHISRLRGFFPSAACACWLVGLFLSPTWVPDRQWYYYWSGSPPSLHSAALHGFQIVTLSAPGRQIPGGRRWCMRPSNSTGGIILYVFWFMKIYDALLYFWLVFILFIFEWYFFFPDMNPWLKFYNDMKNLLMIYSIHNVSHQYLHRLK